MATSGALADFKRMPAQRKALVFGIVGLLIGALYFQFGYRSLTESIDTAENTYAAKLQTNKTLGDNIPKYEEAKTKYSELTSVIAQNQTALPTEAELPAFFETLNRKVLEAGVQVINYRRAPEEKVESFIKAPVKFEITGTFMQIKRFFASLVQKDLAPAVPVPAGSTGSDAQSEERERIVSIENLTLSTPVVKDRQLYLTAKFTASTFRQEEKKAPPPAPGAAGAGSGAGGAGSAAMPMPSAATPAGAKARTENALEKGDAKDRNATGVDEAKTPAGSGSNRLKGGI